MRYSSALVLGTVAVAQAGGLRHASFHARRQAEASKRDINDVDWSHVSYDLTNVDWSTVFPTPAPTPETPAPAPVAPAPAPSAPVPANPAPPVSSAAPAPAKPSTPTTSGDDTSDLLYGVDTIIKSMNLKGPGVNSLTNNGGLWIGDDSPWKTEFTNDGAGDAVIFCWESKGYSGMSLNVNLPAISVGLKPGKSVTVSFGENVPAACAPAFADTKMANFGGIDNTWYEATFNSQGAFDVSRNVNMKGNNISAKGSKCTSDMTTCVFQCQDSSAASCETGYQIAGADAPGCGSGFDANMNGVGGGCSVGAAGETVKVTFS